jgi:hypothetical protein
MHAKTLHLRSNTTPHGSPSGRPVFDTACGRRVMIGAITDYRRAVECRHCLKRKSV